MTWLPNSSASTKHIVASRKQNTKKQGRMHPRLNPLETKVYIMDATSPAMANHMSIKYAWK